MGSTRMLAGSYDCGLLAFSESSESAHFPWLGIHDKDSLNIELNFGYEQTITHPFPKGTWISIEMSEKFDPDLETITHILKLNNDVVYTKERFNQPNEITNIICDELFYRFCVEGFYRNLKIDFGTCGEQGSNCFFAK